MIRALFVVALVSTGCGRIASSLSGDPATPATAGPVDARGLSPCRDALTRIFTEDAIAPRGRDAGFTPLDTSAQRALVESLRRAADGRNADAVERARHAGYSVCLSTGGVRVWRPGDGLDGPVFAWRAGAGRAVILEAPHPFYESDTLVHGLRAFTRGDVHALLVSGAHRCAARARSGCDGTTSVCDGTRLGFRLSDPAHATQTAFHAIHMALIGLHPRAIVIGLHNMRADGVSLSDGTTGDVSRSGTIGRTVTAIARTLPALRLTACNPGAGATVEARHCGATDIQGRAVNGSSDPCDDSARKASGRFIHLEWHKDLSRGDASALLDAVIGAQPAAR